MTGIAPQIHTKAAGSGHSPTSARGPRPRLGTAGAPKASDERGRHDRGDEPRFGTPGRKFSRTTPFFIGLTGALGVGLAYLVVRSIADIAQVLTIIGIALFLGIGLQPAVLWLEGHRSSRPLAVVAITFCFLAVLGVFAAAAIPPMAHEAHDLITNFPRYRANVADGKGWLGHLVTKFHLASYVRGKAATKTLKTAAAGGVIGAGRLLFSTTAAAVTIVVLTVYFLVALPSASQLWLGLVPASRRERVSLLIEEVFGRVGGFVLGNLITSVVAGVGTTLWLTIFGVPYAFLLGLFVAIMDLIPIVGSSVGGVVVSLVALTKGLPVAIATAGFYVFYRLFEDYLLVPRVMNRTVRISPGLTIMATLLGAALLGLIGAIVAIPIAAGLRLVLEEVVFPATDRL
ncbi:MAG: AI-2E family transporter [Acidimicrobiales bacterium]|jgi:predicted PurR-regulated permease PerM